MQSLYLKRLYAFIAIVAFIMCWSQNIAYFQLGLLRFISDALINPAARSISFDIAWLFVAAVIFMIVESKRLKIPHVWAYIVFGLIVAISVTFPLFLIARENKLKHS